MYLWGKELGCVLDKAQGIGQTPEEMPSLHSSINCLRVNEREALNRIRDLKKEGDSQRITI